MDAKECAEVLRSFIGHREKMHQETFVFIETNGNETQGKINVENDILYHAAKFALTCVEEKIPK